MSTYDLKFIADVSGVASGLQQIPGMTEKQSARAALKQVQISRDAAIKAQKIQEETAKKTESAWTKAFKGLSKVAGMGEMAEKADALGGSMEGVSLASGVAVAGVAAVGVAVLGAAAGTVKLMRGARDAIESIDKLGVTQIITKDQRASIAEANASIDAIGVGIDAMTVALASGLGPAVSSITEKVVGLELMISKTIGAFDTGALSINSWTSLIKAAAIGGILPFIDGLLTIHRMLGTNTDAMEGFAAGLHESALAAADNAFAIHADTAEQKASLAVSTDAAKVIDQVTAANARGTTAYQKHAEAVKKAAAAEKERADAVAKIFAEGDAKLAEERFQAEIKAESDKLAAHLRVQDAIAIADDQDMEAFRARAKERTKIKTEEDERDKASIAASVGMAADAIGQLASMYEDAHMGRLTQLEDERKAFLKMAKAQMASASQFEKDQMNLHAQGIDKRIRAEKRMIIAAFIAKQSAAVAAIGMDTAVAVMKALADLGPVAGGVAAGLIIGTGAIQAGLVVAQKPPKFARGGEVTATLEQGEGIANKRAMAQPGFRQALDSANEGRGGSGGNGDTHIYFNDRLIMTLMARGYRLGGLAVPAAWARAM